MRSTKSKSIRNRLIVTVILVVILMCVPYAVLITSGKDGFTLLPYLITYVVIVAAVLIAYTIHSAKKTFARFAEIDSNLRLMSEGKLGLHIDDIANDEIGRTSASFNAFSVELTKAIKELIDFLDPLSKGNLTKHSEYVWKGDWGKINTDLERITKSLTKIFIDVKEASDQTASGSEQVASGSQALAQGATEQASSIEQLSATVSEISDHVKNTASNAAEASRASGVAENKLNEADDKMNSMVKAMGEISETSEQISNIIKTIDNIAFQTNILALNAAVEAARAGSAGKGFAVVADEVRNLASKSSEAAKDTTDLIENSMKAVENGNNVAGSTKKTLTEVMQASSRANELIGEIADASNQQATSIGQITQGVQQISAVVQTNSATAEESAAASEELAAQAKALKKSLQDIILDDSQTKKPFIPAKKAPAASGTHASSAAGAKKRETVPATAKSEAVPVFKNDKNDKYI